MLMKASVTLLETDGDRIEYMDTLQTELHFDDGCKLTNAEVTESLGSWLIARVRGCAVVLITSIPDEGSIIIPDVWLKRVRVCQEPRIEVYT